MKKYSLLAALAFSALTVTATPKESTSQGTPQDMDKFITELIGQNDIAREKSVSSICR